MHYKYIILGAGCAGLSLCWYLLQEGVRDPILLLDRKTDFANDRTWCFWDTEPTPFTHLATHCWPAWSVRRCTGESFVRASAPSTPYVRLRGSDFYQTVLAEINEHPNVTLRLGVPLSGGYKNEVSGGVAVSAGSETFHGDLLFDALSLGSPRFPVARSRDVTFLQKFWGQTIHTDRDVFDPQTVTLMDFAIPPTGVDGREAAQFMYVLPFGPREALVEFTALLPARGRAKDFPVYAAGAAEGRSRIAAYLRERYAVSKYSVVGEEQGMIPMTSRSFPLRTGNHTFSIGLAGGAARPSSGYAFLRIQKQCRVLAQAVARGEWNHIRNAAPTRTALLDRVFLRAMQQNPQNIPNYFHRLFARVPPPALVRLLSGSASVWDCARVVRALPLGDFARAAAMPFLQAAQSDGL